MLTITASSATWFLPFAIPIAIWVSWSDMKFMKIPNKAVIALFGIFVIVGLLALPFEDYLWRYLNVLVVLVVGFFLNLRGAVGAGDAKFAAAMAAFFPATDSAILLYFFAAVLLGAFTTHRGFRRLRFIRSAFPDWESWENRDFPMGLALTGALIFYLAAGVFLGT
ncbi:MAG: prepilin peptidase [Pseudomonadota bacterium]